MPYPSELKSSFQKGETNYVDIYRPRAIIDILSKIFDFILGIKK